MATIISFVLSEHLETVGLTQKVVLGKICLSSIEKLGQLLIYGNDLFFRDIYIKLCDEIISKLSKSFEKI